MELFGLEIWQWHYGIMNLFVLVWATTMLLESSTWYANWKHKRRIKKSDYVLNYADVVILKGE